MGALDAICGDWDDRNVAERLDALADLIDETLSALGYAPVSVVAADLATRRGQYGGGRVELDREHLQDDGLAEIVDTAFHEAAHAIEDQDGDYAALDEDTRADYFNHGMNFVLTPDGDLRGASDDLHADVEAFAAWMTENAIQHCMGQPTESAFGALFGLKDPDRGGDGDAAAPGPAAAPMQVDWQEEVSGDGGGGDVGFEILWDEAVVTGDDGDLPDGDLDLADGGGP